MVVWTVFMTLGVFVCVLSAWMSRLGNGGVSKCYAPITAFHAQSPDHIPTCYLTVHTDCLSLCVSLCDCIHLFCLDDILQLVRSLNSPRVQSDAFSDSRGHAPRIPHIRSRPAIPISP